MSEGLVKCCGSPLFLKKIFGAGYHLRVSKGHNFMGNEVMNIIRSYIPNSQIKSDINTEIIYTLENDNNVISDQVVNSSSQLASLFDKLEKSYRKLGINSCGLTVTTMEDVFLRVGNECIDNEKMVKTNNYNNNGRQINGSNERIIQMMINKNSGSQLLWQQFYALFLKRLHYAKRYWPMITLQTILPALLFMCALLIDYAMKYNFSKGMPSLTLDLNMYGSTKGIIKSNITDNNFNNIYKSVANKQLMDTSILNNNGKYSLLLFKLFK
jgi:ATP-binding cassette, subfamily A (ABC1), member 3